jgi:UDP-glucose 4-epimerase
MKRALVTGGAGAIGSNLTRALIERGLEVIVLDDLSSGHRVLVPHAATFIEGSVSDDAAVDRAFAANPDCVFHLAALFANQNSVDHPDADLNANGLCTVKVLRAAVAHGVRKLLFTSSSCVYGAKEVMREGDHDFDLDTPYAVTKLAGEHYVRLWTRLYQLDTVIVRLFNSYGPHEYPGRYRNVIPNFIKLAMEGRPLPITGTGEETRDFTFNGDTVAGIVGAMFGATGTGDVFNIASGRDIAILRVAESINRLVGNRAGVEFKPRRAWDRVMRRRGDIGRAQRTFGYTPKVALDEGLERTYAWIKSAVR